MGTNDKCDAIDNNPNCGVIPRALRDVFATILERSDSHDVEVRVTYIELYKEEFRDLLSNPNAPEVPIVIREGANGGGPVLLGASELPVRTFQEVMEFLARGNERRAVGATAMNTQSSRSHAILTLNIAESPKQFP
jgi:hypothetical protein